MKKRILLTLLLLTFISTSSFALYGKPADWAIDDIESLKELEIFSDNTFSQYEKDISRGEFIYMAVKLYERLSNSEIEIDESISFTDTNDIYAIKGASIGITSGVGNNRFAYNDLLTREQLATFMIRVLNLLEADMKDQSNVKFDDDSNISDWAKEAIYKAKNNNIISGVGSNKVDPQGNASVQVALIISNRILNEYDGKDAHLNGQKITMSKSERSTYKVKGNLSIESEEKYEKDGYTFIKTKYDDIDYIRSTNIDPERLIFKYTDGSMVLTSGNGEILSEKFEELEDFHVNLVTKSKDGYGVINYNGEEIAPPIYNKAYGNQLIKATDAEGKNHYYTDKGIYLNPIMDKYGIENVTYSYENILISSKESDNNKLFGIFDTRGYELLPVKYEQIRSISNSDRYYIVENVDGTLEVFDIRTSQVLKVDKKVKWIDYLGGDLFALKNYKGDDYPNGYPVDSDIVDFQGNIKFTTDKNSWVHSTIKNGFVDISESVEGTDYYSGNASYLHIDTLKIYKDYSVLSDGSLKLTSLSGDIIYTSGIKNPDLEPIVYNTLADSKKIIKVGSKFGIVDRFGRYIINPNYDTLAEESYGLHKAEKNGAYGFINNEEKTIIDFKYDMAYSFTDGYAAVEVDGKWKYIDTSGKDLKGLEFDEARMFNNGYAQVRKGDKWAYINASGDFISDFEFDEVRPFSGYFKLTTAKKNGKWGIIDYNGDTYADFIYDEISDGSITYDREKLQHYTAYKDDKEVLIECTFDGIKTTTLGGQAYRNIQQKTVLSEDAEIFGRMVDGNYQRYNEYSIDYGKYSGSALVEVTKAYGDDTKEDLAYFGFNGQEILPFSDYSKLVSDENKSTTKYYDTRNKFVYEVIDIPELYEDIKDDKRALLDLGSFTKVIYNSTDIGGFESVEIINNWLFNLESWTNNHFHRKKNLSFSQDIKAINDMFFQSRLSVNDRGVVQNSIGMEPNSFYAKLFLGNDDYSLYDDHPYIKIKDWCTSESQKGSPMYSATLNMARQMFKYYCNSNEDGELLYDFVMNGFMTKAKIEYGVEMEFGGTTVIIYDPGVWGINIVFVEHSIGK